MSSRPLTYVVVATPTTDPIYWEVCAMEAGSELLRLRLIFQDETVAEDMAKALQDANDALNP